MFTFLCFKNTINWIQTGWLEPLLDRVVAYGIVIVTPEINSVYENTFGMSTSQMTHIGGINLEGKTK